VRGGNLANVTRNLMQFGENTLKDHCRRGSWWNSVLLLSSSSSSRNSLKNRTQNATTFVRRTRPDVNGIFGIRVRYRIDVVFRSITLFQRFQLRLLLSLLLLLLLILPFIFTQPHTDHSHGRFYIWTRTM